MIPEPAEADAVTLAVEATGEETLLPVGKVQAASVDPVHPPLPVEVLLTYRFAVALLPVSTEFTKTLPVVLV